ncbi:MAG: hypothetical protein KDB00_07590, partial [Planctomycetales bacterium]|nr:hypothetical protein [Planctomycetales bacterium]
MNKSISARLRRLSLALALATCFGTSAASADDTYLGFPSGAPAPLFQTASLYDDDGLAESDGETAPREAGDGGTVPMKDYKELLGRVDDLESSWDDYQKKLKSEADDKKKKPAYKLNGRIHLDNWNFLDSDAGINQLETGNPNDDPEDRWDFRRIRLTYTGDVPGNMLYRISIDFNNPSAAEMKDVYLGFKDLPHNQEFLIGNQKRPIGLDHLNS